MTGAPRRLHHCLAVCTPGIEAVCAAELIDLGVRIRRALQGGVEFSATDRQLYAANLWSRTATRIVVRVASFKALSFGDLEGHIEGVDWGRFVPEGATPEVRVSSTASRLYHTDAVAERVAALASPHPGDGRSGEPRPLIVVRLIHDRVMVSVDSSGDPLHQRGWRLDAAKAPLRETLAAALVLAAGWDPGAPLVDPLCGSGTIAIEAALLAMGRAPAAGRRFGFWDWPSFAPGTWASVAGAPHPAAAAPAPTGGPAGGPATIGPAGPGGATPATPVIVASDRDAGAVRATAANAERAGVSHLVSIHRRPLSALEPGAGLVGTAPGWLITNPPYGKRVAGGDLRDLYACLGRLATERLAGWVVGLLAADRRLAGHTGLALTRRLETRNGGIPVDFLVADPRR